MEQNSQEIGPHIFGELIVNKCGRKQFNGKKIVCCFLFCFQGMVLEQLDIFKNINKIDKPLANSSRNTQRRHKLLICGVKERASLQTPIQCPYAK